jgi:hypothetical protein
LAGEPETDKTNMALDWRQTTAYQFFAKIYAPHLGFGGDAATRPEGVKGMKEKVEPIVKHFLGDGKFIGGAADACVLWKKGELQSILEQAGAKPQGAVPGAPEWNGYSGDPFEVCASGHD